MATFYCSSPFIPAHLPYPGAKVTAVDAAAAALAIATTHSIAPGVKVLVIEESALSWFVVGGVAPVTPPTYT